MNDKNGRIIFIEDHIQIHKEEKSYFKFKIKLMCPYFTH